MFKGVYIKNVHVKIKQKYNSAYITLQIMGVKHVA
jgi:hypothetical protein